VKYILVDISTSARKLLCVSEESEFAKVLARLKLRYNCREVSRPPSQRTIQRWRARGKCKAVCGCWIACARGERCLEHNAMSWLTAVYNMYGQSSQRTSLFV
jgi:hypothetical protein